MKKKESNLIGVFALAIAMIALCNPHFETERYNKERIFTITGYKELANNRLDWYLWGYEPDVKTAKIQCTEGVTISNDFDSLCQTPGQLWCATRPLWELKGTGVCIVNYSGNKRHLKWF